MTRIGEERPRREHADVGRPLAGEPRQRGGGRGRGGKPAGQAGDGDPTPIAHNLHRHITSEGDGRDQHGEQPDFVRIDRSPTIDGAIREDGQKNEAHDQQHEAGPQLLPRQSLQPLVKPALGGEQRRRCDGGGGGGDLVAGDREGPERIGQHQGDDRGRAEGPVVLGFPIAKRRHHGPKQQEGQRQRDRAPVMAEFDRDRAPDAAQQGGQPMRAHAGGAFAFLLRTRAPAAFEADQKTDRERICEAPYEFGRAHFKHVA